MIIFIKLGIAYFTQGFFIRLINQHIIGLQGELITALLGVNEEVIEGWINHNVNYNNTLRIMLGVRYTSWVQENYELGDMMKVKIVSPTKLILYKKGEQH